MILAAVIYPYVRTYSCVEVEISIATLKKLFADCIDVDVAGAADDDDAHLNDMLSVIMEHS